MTPDPDPPFEPTGSIPPHGWETPERAAFVGLDPASGKHRWHRPGPDHAYSSVWTIDLGRPHRTDPGSGSLFIEGFGSPFTPSGVLLAARLGYFGFRVQSEWHRPDSAAPVPPPNAARRRKPRA